MVIKTLLTKIFEFDASHKLSERIGGENHGRLHGHRYKLEVSVKGDINEDGIIMDASEIKKIVKELVLNNLDHNHLNEFIENPTVENIAKWIWERLKTKIDKLYEIKVWETINATYMGG
ncbi:MAG: 6-carboxytetrahydropterin synthase QueD [Nanoarchaeota archaeon]